MSQPDLAFQLGSGDSFLNQMEASCLLEAVLTSTVQAVAISCLKSRNVRKDNNNVLCLSLKGFRVELGGGCVTVPVSCFYSYLSGVVISNYTSSLLI